jgi:hypothetical protein
MSWFSNGSSWSGAIAMEIQFPSKRNWMDVGGVRSGMLDQEGKILDLVVECLFEALHIILGVPIASNEVVMEELMAQHNF